MLEDRKKENLTLRRSYRGEVKKLLRVISFNRNKNARLRNNAMRRIKTIANALLNEIARKLAQETKAKLDKEPGLYFGAVNQKRPDKIYSLHEPEAECIAKEKEHKKSEFGTKVALAQTITDGIIDGARNAFNEYDGNCLAPLFRQVEKTTGKRPERAYCDRGFRGRSNIEGTEIVIPDNLQKEGKRTKKATRRENSDAGARLRQRSVISNTISAW